MNTRERFQAIMAHQPFDRLPVLEWAAWWDLTLERWHGEGLPTQLTDRYDISAHFGLDIYKQDRFAPYGGTWPRGIARAERQAGYLASAGEYDTARLALYPSAVVDRDLWSQRAAEQERGDVVLWFMLDGFFWFPRDVLGVERHLYAYYDEPELLHRMNADIAEWHIAVIEELCSVCTPDFVTFAEDMSYNHGPMLSKDLFDEFVKPYYELVVPVLKDHGILVFVDSDGDITIPAHWFEQAGIMAMLPLERQAGVDIDRLRREHPQMGFLGHFDKMVMAQGESALRAEFERLLPAAAMGGFIPGCDHQTPPEVSYRDYQLYLSLFREYAERAGRMFLDAGGNHERT